MRAEVDLAQLHPLDAVGAAVYPQFDRAVAGLARRPVGQPDSVSVAIVLRQSEIEQTADGEIRIRLQTKVATRIDVGAERRVLTKEGVARRRSSPKPGVSPIQNSLAVLFRNSTCDEIGLYETGIGRYRGRRNAVIELIVKRKGVRAGLNDFELIDLELIIGSVRWARADDAPGLRVG